MIVIPLVAAVFGGALAVLAARYAKRLRPVASVQASALGARAPIVVRS